MFHERAQPLFPFGYGLSDTTFAHSGLEVTPKAINPGDAVRVQVRVTNTGTRAGTVTPQAYLSFPSGAVEPPQRLLASERVRLAPGESKRVTMSLPRTAYSYWNSPAHNWDVAAGRYRVSVGPPRATCRFTGGSRRSTPTARRGSPCMRPTASTATRARS